MQFPTSLTLLSSIAHLASTTVALPDPMSFTGWPCAQCEDSIPGCKQKTYAPKQSDTCYQLDPTRGLKIVQAQPNCELRLFKEPECKGVLLVYRQENPTPPSGPTCNNPQVLAEKRFYQVVCY